MLNVTLSARTYKRHQLREYIGHGQQGLDGVVPITLQWQLPYMPHLDFVTVHQRKAEAPLSAHELTRLVEEEDRDGAKYQLPLNAPIERNYTPDPKGDTPAPTPGFAGERILPDLTVGHWIFVYHMGGQSQQLQVAPWVAFEFNVV
jgi:hypothetical protein